MLLNGRFLILLAAMAGLLGIHSLAAPAEDPPKRIKVIPIRPRDTHIIEGKDLYVNYCAVCHGREGKADGPASSALKQVPPDLTRLAEREGGKYPAGRVRMTILGEESIPAHGDKEMPVWGPIFREMSSDAALGELRVANLIKFIEEMQAK